MTLIITDTNILFDVISIGALPELFSLDYEICTTVFVLQEIKLSDQKEAVEVFVRAKELTVIEFDSDDISEIEAFKTSKNFKGITDKSVLWKALKLDCPLLTGDRKLRLEAENQGVEVHGTIWVIERLVEQNLINVERGVYLLETLKQANSSLPLDAINKLIEKYRKED